MVKSEKEGKDLKLEGKGKTGLGEGKHKRRGRGRLAGMEGGSGGWVGSAQSEGWTWSLGPHGLEGAGV